MRKFCLLGLWLLIGPVWAASDYTSAAPLVSAIQDKLKGVTDYSMVAFTEDTQHAGVLDYRCVRPDNIRTEVLDGPHRGTIILYLPAVKDKMVKVKAGNKRVWRSIQKLKIADTPLVESVLDKFAGDLAQYTFTLKAHQKVRLDVGKPVPARPGQDDWSFGDDPELSASPSPVASPALGQSTVEKDCYLLDGTRSGEREQLAIDRNTLFPVAIKHWKSGHPDFDAEVWKLEVNTHPTIDF